MIVAEMDAALAKLVHTKRAPTLDNFAGQAVTGTPRGPRCQSNESVVRWKTPIPGKGWSSPVVWDDQVWLTTATEDGTEMSVLCVDRKSGKIVHDRVLITNQSPAFCHPTNSCASPTPVIEAGRVYVHFGFMASPAVVDDELILCSKSDLYCVATSDLAGSDSKR